MDIGFADFLKKALALRLARFDAAGDLLLDSSGNVAIRKVKSYTWANRPAAAANQGVTIRITDIGGSAGSLWISDGAYWKPVGGSIVLGMGNTRQSCVGTSGTDETLASLTIPGYLMGANGRIRVTGTWRFTGNNAAKNAKVKFGNMVPFSASEAANAATRTVRFMAEFANKSDITAQVSSTGSGDGLFSGSKSQDVVTGSENTATDKTLLITGSCANAGDTCSLETWVVELLSL